MGHIRRPCGGTGHGFRPRGAIVRINGTGVNSNSLALVTNPYSIRSRRRVYAVTRSMGSTNTRLVHNNTFGPEASPCSFRKLHRRNLHLLTLTGRRAKLPVMARVVSVSRVSGFTGCSISMVRINTHGVRGFRLLGTLNAIGGPVLLGHNLTGACRRLLVSTRCVVTNNGSRIVLYRENVHAFRACAEGALSITTVPILGALSRLPMVVSPDRSTNGSTLITPLSCTTTTTNYSNLVVRMRGSPTRTLYSKPRYVGPSAFTSLMAGLITVHRTVG